MSGGSLDYLYSKVDDAANRIGGSPIREAFATHLRKVADTLKAVEWAMSCDTSDESADESIRKLLGPGAELKEAIRMAEVARACLEGAIINAKAEKNS